jgi:transcriptional regulator with XRE-family HTH domain
MRIGQLIGIARECRGFPLRELEKRTGISNALISQIETGKVKSPSFESVVRLSRELGVSLDRCASCVPDFKNILRGSRS